MKKHIFLLAFGITITIALVSCYYDKEDYLYPCDNSANQGPLFQAAQSVIETQCVGCHSGNRAKGGYAFDTPCDIVTQWAAINNSCVATDRMPEGEPLTAAEKETLRAWIVNGNHQIGN